MRAWFENFVDAATVPDIGRAKRLLLPKWRRKCIPWTWDPSWVSLSNGGSGVFGVLLAWTSLGDRAANEDGTSSDAEKRMARAILALQMADFLLKIFEDENYDPVESFRRSFSHPLETVISSFKNKERMTMELAIGMVSVGMRLPSHSKVLPFGTKFRGSWEVFLSGGYEKGLYEALLAGESGLVKMLVPRRRGKWDESAWSRLSASPPSWALMERGFFSEALSAPDFGKGCPPPQKTISGLEAFFARHPKECPPLHESLLISAATAMRRSGHGSFAHVVVRGASDDVGVSVLEKLGAEFMSENMSHEFLLSMELEKFGLARFLLPFARFSAAEIVESLLRIPPPIAPPPDILSAVREMFSSPEAAKADCVDWVRRFRDMSPLFDAGLMSDDVLSFLFSLAKTSPSFEPFGEWRLSASPRLVSSLERLSVCGKIGQASVGRPCRSTI